MAREGWWADSWCASAIHPGESFETVFGSGRQFVIHCVGGLETLAAKEVASIDGCHVLLTLVGKVVFVSDASIDTLLSLHTAEMLSLLCWATPTPSMPLGKSPPCQGNDLASDDCPATKNWLDHFESLLLSLAIPQLRAIESAWRSAVGHSNVIRFRASVKRGGESSRAVSSPQMAGWLGAVCAEHLGWRVDLKDFDLEVLLQWNDVQVVLECPISNRYRSGDLPMSDRPYLRGAMHGPVAWSIASLACIQPGQLVLDPMVGKGGLVIEAALAHPRARFVGVDHSTEQLSVAAENACIAGPNASHRVELIQGDAIHLPLRDDTVDAIICDLPFGKRHTSAMGIDRLYASAISEMARVAKIGATVVLFSTKKALMSRIVVADARWTPMARYEVNFGNLKAFAVVVRRNGSCFSNEPGLPSDEERTHDEKARVAAGKAHAFLAVLQKAVRRQRAPLCLDGLAGNGGKSTLLVRTVTILGNKHNLKVQKQNQSFVAVASEPDLNAALGEIAQKPSTQWRHLLVPLCSS